MSKFEQHLGNEVFPLIVKTPLAEEVLDEEGGLAEDVLDERHGGGDEGVGGDGAAVRAAAGVDVERAAATRRARDAGRREGGPVPGEDRMSTSFKNILWYTDKMSSKIMSKRHSFINLYKKKGTQTIFATKKYMKKQ